MISRVVSLTLKRDVKPIDKNNLNRGSTMHAKLRILLGGLILLSAIIGAGIVGTVLPLRSVQYIQQINEEMIENAEINADDLIPYTGDPENFSDFLYISNDINTSAYTYQTVFEFYNISNRNAYLDYGSKVSYNYVPNQLVFDVTFKRIVIDYSAEDNYIVFAKQKLYVLNETASTLDPNTQIINYNYMWPYYIKHFGNGTEYGFQAYVAAHLIQSELKELQQEKGYTDEELAYITLNRNFAESEGVLTGSIYLPHNWLHVRPAYVNLNFDQSTSYHILYNATYNGHDYSLFTGEAGSVKFFLDLVQGLYYSPEELILNVTKLLADIYQIDTPLELEYAKSFAAYLEFLLGKPSLDWLFENKIAYLCKRTALEWVLGIPDPLLDNRVFPLVKNDTLTDNVDLSTDMYYAERPGTKNITEVGQIFAIANIPYYEQDISDSVSIEDGLAYVTNGVRGLRIVNTTDPLMLGIGQYSNSIAAKAAASDGTFAVVAQGTHGALILNVSDPTNIEMIDMWTNSGNADFNDVQKVIFGTASPLTAFVFANGQYGVTIATLAFDGFVDQSYTLDTTGSALSARVSSGTSNRRIYVAEGTDGIDVISVPSINSMSLLYHYDSTDFPELQNVIKVQPADGYLYVLDAVNGLLIFSDNSGQLTLEGQLAVGVGENYYTSIAVESSSRVFLTQGNDGVVAVDVSNKQNPSIIARFDSDAGHKGTAMDIIIGDDGDLYLADYSEGLVHLSYSNNVFQIINKDELRTFVEAWNKPSKGQFTNWPVNDNGVARGFEDRIHEIYDSHTLYPNVQRGLRLQWNEYFLAPFLYSSLRDVAIKAGMTVLPYSAEYDTEYLQLEQFDFYWMTSADFFNTSFMHVGYWNKLYDAQYSPTDVFITHSFPGEVRDAAIHLQEMWVEPITGTVAALRDRVQYNTLAVHFIEQYSLLNESVVDIKDQRYRYQTWHQTNPGQTGNMGKLFWQEDVIEITENKADMVKQVFLHRIANADASRTTGAFSALALTTVGFVGSSLFMAKFADKPGKKK